MTRLIVDVSAANARGRATGRTAVQDDLDWQWIAAQGVVGCYVEGYVGNDGPNLDMEDQLHDATSAGLLTGIYDFVYPLPNALGHANRDPVAQARIHATNAGTWRPGQLPPMADLEWPSPGAGWVQWGCSQSQIEDWLCAYLVERDRLAGTACGIYTYLDFWEQMTPSNGVFPAEYFDRPLWVAGSSAWARSPWTAATLWQMTGKELHVPTTSGRPPVLTDCSQFLGDDAAWSAFLGVAPTAD
jgi:GH25 family lysozyme M1 (1,4-beta-N-acetylmuramidase)